MHKLINDHDGKEMFMFERYNTPRGGDHYIRVVDNMESYEVY